MDIGRIERRLKKISTVVDAFKEDNRITPIEKDLLLSYIRELYDIVRDGEIGIISNTPETTSSPSPAPEVAEAPPTTAPIIQKSFVEEAKPEVTPVSSPVKQAEVVETHQAATTKAEIETTKVSLSSEMASLFIEEKATELSERLSMSPISDISKAFGINERIFTITELFGNDNDVFNKTIEQLNAASNFEQATSILVNGVASKYKWDSEEKWKKAQQFIRSVRRRYL